MRSIHEHILNQLGKVSKWLVVIGVLLIALPTVAQTDVDLADLVAVKEYMKKSSLCDKIELVNMKPSSFVEEGGYAHLILSKISKEIKQEIHIPIGDHHGRVYTHEERVNSIMKQMKGLFDTHCSESK